MPRPDSSQGSLFEPRPAAAGALNFDAQLRAAISDSIDRSRLPRQLIAEEMERLLGTDPDYPVSKALIDAWTAPSRSGWRLPALYVPAFCAATEDDRVLRLIVGKSGAKLMDDEAESELGRLEAEALQIRERQKLLRAQLRERGRR